MFHVFSTLDIVKFYFIEDFHTPYDFVSCVYKHGRAEMETGEDQDEEAEIEGEREKEEKEEVERDSRRPFDKLPVDGPFRAN